MVKKSEINRLQRGKSRRKSRGRTSKEDKTKTPLRKKKGIRKPRKTNRRRTKRRRTKRSMNEGKGEAGVLGLWNPFSKKAKTVPPEKTEEEEGVEQSDINLNMDSKAAVDSNEINRLEEIFESLLRKKAKDAEEKMTKKKLLESAIETIREKNEYMIKFTSLREALRKADVFDSLNDNKPLEKKLYNIEKSVVNAVRQIFKSISNDESSGKPLTLQQISKINEIMDENTNESIKEKEQR